MSIITQAQISTLINEFKQSSVNTVIQNAVSMNDLRTLAVNWSKTKTSDISVFSDQLPK